MITVTVSVTYHFIHGFTMRICCCVYMTVEILFVFPSKLRWSPEGRRDSEILHLGSNKVRLELWTVGSKCNVTECLIVITIWPQVTIMHSYIQQRFQHV